MQTSDISSLIAHLRASKAHPRHRLQARTDGLVPQVAKVLDQLQELHVADIKDLLVQLKDWSSDYDFVVELAYRGCFRYLRRIMEGKLYDACGEMLTELGDVIVSHGFSIFQSRNILDDRVVDRLKPIKYSFEVADGVDMEVLVKQVAQQQESQYTVGYIMWSAAVILSRMICRNPSMVSGKQVLEVGAGLGLCGIVAARWASEITLSDYNPTILRNMEHNILINKQEHAGVAIENAAISSSTPVHVRFLDWEQLAGPEQEQPSEMKVAVDDPSEAELIQPLSLSQRFDVIIASDIVCQRQDAFGVVRTLLAFLAPGGTAHVVLPCPNNRYGVEAFPEALEEAGLKFTCTRVDDATLTLGIEEASYFQWDYFMVQR